ncbi:MAG: M23 family metallopeptidase [Bryobacteraceae bacterium]
MGWLVPGVVVLFDFLLPAALFLWMLKTRAASRLYFASIAALTLLVLVALKWSVLGFWYAVGSFWPLIYGVLFVAILYRRFHQGLPVLRSPRRGSKELALTGLNVVLGAAWALTIPYLLQARHYPVERVQLAAPLRNSTYFVISGGSNFTVNQHLGSRWDRYALDITRLNALGLRAFGFFPGELSDYAVFGAEVVAPCSGEVLAVETNLPNRRPLDPDAGQRAGNHVVVYCQGHSILLAHMNPGSISVKAGDRVVSGQPLGTVGNSGNTIEPHLHIGAIRGRYDYTEASRPPGGVNAVPILIDGASLIRADSFGH